MDGARVRAEGAAEDVEERALAGAVALWGRGASERERECVGCGKGGTYAEEGYFRADRNNEVDVLEEVALAVVGLAEAVCPEGAVGARGGHEEERAAGGAGGGWRRKGGRTGEDGRGHAVEGQDRG